MLEELGISLEDCQRQVFEQVETIKANFYEFEPQFWIVLASRSEVGDVKLTIAR